MNVQTVFDKALLNVAADRFEGLTARDVTQELINMGLIDTRRCKSFIIRRYVDAKVKEGMSKTDAMYSAAELYCCSYECVRKYIYYYKN